MPWYRIEMSSYVAQQRATGLITEFSKLHLKAGAPQEARVYHCKLPDGDHIYYLSPEAVALAECLLRQIGVTACSGEPDLAGFRLIKL